LKRRKLIDQLFKEGRSFAVAPLRVYYMPTVLPETVVAQAGVGVSKKHFKKATHRNRIKRLTREAYRLQKQPLIAALQQQGQQMLFFFIYTGKTMPDYPLILEKMNLLLNKLASGFVQPK
jgi:ribonuclease P protein component